MSCILYEVRHVKCWIRSDLAQASATLKLCFIQSLILGLLKSEHWKRVRAAILSSGQGCRSIGSMQFGLVY